jgi:DNA (cytosine-5)-methyltransferase 1
LTSVVPVVEHPSRLNALWEFLGAERRSPAANDPTAVSLFSGAGLSDIGFSQAGFRFLAHVEIDPNRVEIGRANFSESQWLAADVREVGDQLVQAVDRPSIDLLVATPPCQGMSSSNPSRGKRAEGKPQDARNNLALAVLPIIRRLRPRVVLLENVRQFLTQPLESGGRTGTIVEWLRDLQDYAIFTGSIDVADYGIPQTRRRGIVALVSTEVAWTRLLEQSPRLPWPKATHGDTGRPDLEPWITVGEWLRGSRYEPLDAKDPLSATGHDPLHFVPTYVGARYLQVSSIPPNSGLSAYQNSSCLACQTENVPPGMAYCPSCSAPMENRPNVTDGGGFRLIKGFASSYRRMRTDRPAPTVMTNSSHVGSDFKIHPWENRVLSALECADLQTVPRFFDWTPAITSRRRYLVRNLVGEALPPYLTYLHGRSLCRLLTRGLLGTDLPTLAKRAK